MTERLRRFLRRWLYQEIHGWLVDFQASQSESHKALSAFVTASQEIQAQTLNDTSKLVCEVLDAQMDALREQGERIAEAVKQLDTVTAELRTATAVTFREFECVDYAVDKLEFDDQLMSRLDEEARIKECASWAALYAKENGWTVPANGKLRELILLKRQLNEERVIRNG